MKKTLIINGSPRKSGDTAFLVRELQNQLSGEVQVVHAYTADISPCVDCRYCWKHPACCRKDAMQGLYAEIAAADHLVIASPIYFSNLTGPLLSVASRLQLFYAARTFLGKELLPKPKKGALILCGGGNGAALPAEKTARLLLQVMHASCNCRAYALHTDTLPAEQDQAAQADIRRMAAFFNAKPLTEK